MAEQTLTEQDVSVIPLVKELERYMRFITKPEYPHAFEMPMSAPVRIVVQMRGQKRTALGWFAPNAWSTKEGEQFSEITLVAEAFEAPTIDVLGTLQHELVHAFNHSRGLKDVSGSMRHNKVFRDAAEAAGLKVESQGSRGFAATEPTDELRVFIENEFQPDEHVFQTFRQVMPKKKTVKGKMRKWVCDCEKPTIIRASTKVEAKCLKCQMPFIMEPGQEPLADEPERIDVPSLDELDELDDLPTEAAPEPAAKASKPAKKGEKKGK